MLQKPDSNALRGVNNGSVRRRGLPRKKTTRNLYKVNRSHRHESWRTVPQAPGSMILSSVSIVVAVRQSPLTERERGAISLQGQPLEPFRRLTHPPTESRREQPAPRQITVAEWWCLPRENRTQGLR